MIFVTVGGQPAPFDRLLLALNGLPAEEELVVQCGTSSVRPPGARCFAFVPTAEFVAYVAAARVVVTHGGVGSIMTVLASGKRPIVVPRLMSRGETPDDHQHDFVRRLEAEGLVRLVENVDDLDVAVASLAPDLGAFRPGASSRLVADLRAFLVHLA